jgi:hypothetical protein
MSIKIGDKVSVMQVGDDAIDWAAGLDGVVVDVQLFIDYLYGIKESRFIQAVYHRVTVATEKGNVTVNDSEVQYI